MTPLPRQAAWWGRARRIRHAAAAALGAGALAALTAGVGGPVPDAAGAGSGVARSAPLDTAWTTPQGAWAVIPMGHLGRHTTTFWQVLFRPAASTRWTVVTPPGVATNGGLVGVAGPTVSVTVGIEPSIDLTYSPISRTTTAGKTWTPGILPGGLLAVPDAVATEPDGTVLALLGKGGGTLVASGTSLTRWTTSATARTLAGSAAGRACGVGALEAVAAGTGTPELGVACRRPGVVGILAQAGGTWRSVAPTLRGPAAGDTTTVLRLVSGPSGTAALVEATRGRSSSLFAMWRPATSPAWTISAPAPLTGPLLATGIEASQGMVVVTGTAHHARSAEAIAGPGTAWTALAPPPPDTAAIVGDGSFEALAETGSTLTTWRLDAGSGKWLASGPAHVPIQYGSST